MKKIRNIKLSILHVLLIVFNEGKQGIKRYLSPEQTRYIVFVLALALVLMVAGIPGIDGGG